MVAATHSSSLGSETGPVYAGAEAGFMIAGEGHTIYFSGDTDVMADMGVFQALHSPDIGILCAGGHFTMDMKRAAYAAKTFFDFKTVIPCHYRTFPAAGAGCLRAGRGACPVSTWWSRRDAADQLLRAGEEVLQQPAGLGLADAGIDLRHVMRLRVGKDARGPVRRHPTWGPPRRSRSRLYARGPRWRRRTSGRAPA